MPALRFCLCSCLAALILLAGGCDDSAKPSGPLPTEDRIPPAAVRDLDVRDGDAGAVLTWTSVGDDSVTGSAAAYVLRWIVVDSLDWIWERGAPAGDLPRPSPAGHLDRVVATGLPDSGMFCFRLRVVDDAGNWSGDSNIGYLYRTPETPPDSSWASLPAPDIPILAVDAMEAEGARLYALIRRNDSAGSQGILRAAGEAWEEIGSGLEIADSVGSRLFCIAAFDGRLAAGGSFRSPVDPRVQGIAEWSGEAWRPLGDGIDGIVRAVIPYEEGLVAGGEFLLAGDAGARCIAAWDGSAWRALGEGLAGPVHALSLGPTGILAAGGSFMRAGDRTVSNVALWDGIRWSDASGGLPDPVTRLAWLGSRLVAVVRPTYDRRDFDAVYLYDGIQWTPIFRGDSWSYSSEHVGIGTDSRGALFLAWQDRYRDVRRWDGQTWRNLRPPILYVGALVFREGALIAGGSPLEGNRCFARWVPD